MGSQPLISVCLPAYNNEGFIAPTLESVLSQTWSDFEIIVTDDKSSDRTVAVVEKFADPRVRLLRNEVNLGMGGNWNKALSCARGKYVKLLCGDDVLYPECLQRQVEVLEAPSNQDVALALCGSNVISEDDRVVLRRKCHFGPGRVAGRQLILGCVRWGTNLIGEPAVGLFRRELAGKSGGFDGSNPYLIDLAFWAELLKRGDAFIDPSRLAAFRVSAGSVSTRLGLRHASLFRRFVRRVRRDPAYRATWLDVLLGSVLSFQWCLLRNLFISLRAGRKKSKPGTLAGTLA
jgi:glycosyltransferase involved in cell wall biosynthesis